MLLQHWLALLPVDDGALLGIHQATLIMTLWLIETPEQSLNNHTLSLSPLPAILPIFWRNLDQSTLLSRLPSSALPAKRDGVTWVMSREDCHGEETDQHQGRQGRNLRL